MTKQDKTISNIRSTLSELQNDVIDNAIQHRLDRRSLLLHGSRLGVSLPVLAALSGAMGLGGAAPARAAGRMGGTLRVAILVPPGKVDPVLNNSEPSSMLQYMTGEFLCIVGPDFVLRPNLATSWSPSPDGSVWTFKLRSGVKFTDGSPMNADAVVATVERLLNPKNNSNALSAFRGVLSPGASRKIDDLTVAFHLDAPNGNFPYTMSSDNYNLCILPANYAGNYESTFIGTGPFKLESYTPKVGAAFVRNEAYWGPKAYLDRVEFTFYADDQARALALLGGETDLLPNMPVSSGRSLLNNPKFKIVPAKSSAAEQLHMRCDTGPVPGQARPPGTGPDDRPPGAGQGAVPGPRVDRQRQPVRQRVPLERPHRAAAQAGSEQGARFAGAGRFRQRLQRHADHRAVPGNPGLRGAGAELCR